MADMKWLKADPPEPRIRSALPYREFLLGLQSRPGAWAEFEAASVAASGHRFTAYNAAVQLRKLGAEAYARKTGDSVRVFARWPEAKSNG